MTGNPNRKLTARARRVLGAAVAALLCAVPGWGPGTAEAAPQVLGTPASTKLVGDANGDGVTNFADLQIVERNYGQAGTWAQGDFSGDGKVTRRDAALLMGGYGRPQIGTTFGRLADYTSTVPGGTTGFTLVNAPAVDKSGNAAFYGAAADRLGVYKFTASTGTLSKVADDKTAIPSGTGYFSNFGQPAIWGGKVAIQGVGNSPQEGVFAHDGLTLSKLANQATPNPSGGTLSAFGDPNFLNNVVSFTASSGGYAVYALSGSTITPVVSTSTAIPDGTGTFTSFDSPIGDGSNYWFVGRGINQAGIYRRTGATISRVLDKKTPIGGTGATLSSIGTLSMDGANMSFNGVLSGRQGIFAMIGGEVTKVADTATMIPDGLGKFTGFGASSIGGSSVAFLAYDAAARDGIYAWVHGDLVRVVDTSVALNGKAIVSLSLSRQAVVGNKVLFQAEFADHTAGVYAASLFASPMAGDLNNDGAVDVSDLKLLERNLGTSGGPGTGDMNGDGIVTSVDATLLQQSYGRTGVPATQGDADGNGKVDRADARVVLQNMGKTGSVLQGDFDFDGTVTFADLQVVERNYGRTLVAYEPFGAMAAAADVPDAYAAVPEPAATGLLALGALAWLGRRGARRAKAMN